MNTNNKTSRALRLRLERIERMQSRDKLNKNHPKKKKTGPAVKKESHKSDVSLADKKKTGNKKVIGKAEPQQKKKSARIIKTKPSKNPVLPAAAKRQPAKGKPAGKAEKPREKKAAPTVKEKTFETKVISFETDQLSGEKDVIVTEEIQTQNEMVSSVVLGRRYKCYKCGIKFYDLGKPQPLCPSCGANQLDGVIKAARKRRGKQRSVFVAKTEPHNIAPDENEDLHEAADELSDELVLDMDDIVLEEHEDAEDKK
jgi:rubrerythrin